MTPIKKLIITCTMALTLQMNGLPELNIPIVNIPLAFERAESNTQSDGIALTGTALQHLFLAYTQSHRPKPNKNFKFMLAEHALFAVGRSLLGLTATICHELGHAVGCKRMPYVEVKKINVLWSPTKIITGLYPGNTDIDANLRLETISSNPMTATKAATLTYCDKAESYYSQLIPMYIAGPVVGITSIYTLSKILQHTHPILAQQRFFGIGFFTLFNTWMMTQDILSLTTLNKKYDMSLALKASENLQKMKEFKAEVSNYPENSIFEFPSED